MLLEQELTTTTRRRPLVDEVVDKLVRTIRSLPEGVGGKLLSERSLAERLSVSRPVLREAIQRLESQGLVEVKHGVGVRITSNLHKPIESSVTLLLPDVAERLRQLTEVRLIIEPEAAKMAAIRASEESIRAMKAAVDALRNSTIIELAVQHDVAFHRAIAKASGNQVLSLVLETIAGLGVESRITTITRFGVEPAAQQHWTILNAIEGRNPESAFVAMREHLTITAKDLSELVNTSENSKGGYHE